MAPFLPILSLSRSQNIRIGDAQGGVVGVTRVPGEVGTDINASGTGVLGPVVYVDLADGSSRRDLQRHGAIGGYVVVGHLTNSNTDVVVTTGGTTTPSGAALTSATLAGELKSRTTGVYVPFAAATQTFVLTTIGGQSQVFLVSVNNSTGAYTTTAGTPATTGQQVAPAVPAGNTPLYKITLAHGATLANSGTLVDLRPRP